MAINLLSLFLILFVASFRQCKSLNSNSTGFSLELVRRHFPAKISHIKPINNLNDAILPRISRSSLLFTVEAKIGTLSIKNNFLFDPGSDLTWTQCKPCINCFKQNDPFFIPAKSKSNSKLPNNHTSARYFILSNNGDSMFHSLYGSGQSSSGIASLETFTFPSLGKSSKSMNRVVFGCANKQEGRYPRFFSGIMGMNRSPLSLISQMGEMGRQFSYCLPHINSHTETSLLRVGSNVKASRNLRETSFLTRTVDYNYRVNLTGISVGGHRLDLSTGSFRKGLMLDVGCSGSYIDTHVYNEIVRVLKLHFKQFNLTRVADGSSSRGELCYHLPRKEFRAIYPNMTFHFVGSNFEVGPENLFHVTKGGWFTRGRFCLMMYGYEGVMILGAYQQQNMRMVYDVGGKKKLLFGKEDCSRDIA